MEQLRGTKLKRFNRKNKLKPRNEVVLVLLNFSYATNVAQVFRTADAFGVHKIFLVDSTTTPPFSTKLKKVSRSKENHVEWEHEDDFPKLAKELKRNDFEVLGIELASESLGIEHLGHIHGKRVALVFGNEEHGIPDKHLSHCDNAIYIPMAGKGRSINVATSVAVSLFETVKN